MATFVELHSAEHVGMSEYKKDDPIYVNMDGVQYMQRVTESNYTWLTLSGAEYGVAVWEEPLHIMQLLYDLRHEGE